MARLASVTASEVPVACAVSYAVSWAAWLAAGLLSAAKPALDFAGPIQNWRGRDGNDPSVDIAKDADQRF